MADQKKKSASSKREAPFTDYKEARPHYENLAPSAKDVKPTPMATAPD